MIFIPPPPPHTQESRLIDGVAFKKTFSYAGFEMQRKKFNYPKIVLLNVELELKAEKENAELRIENVEVIAQCNVVCLLANASSFAFFLVLCKVVSRSFGGPISTIYDFMKA